MEKTVTLETFNPAVALLILKGSETPLSEMLKVTFFDLLHRKILEVTKEEYKPKGVETPTELQFVRIGTAGHGYKPLPHEEVFMSYLKTEPTGKLLFQTLVKLAYKLSGGAKSYRRQIIRHGGAAAHFREGFLHRLLGGFDLSDLGIQSRDRLQSEVANLRRVLDDNRERDPDEVAKLLQSLGAIALMIPGFDFAEFPAEPNEMAKTFAQQNDSGYTAISSGCGGFDSWNSMSSTFDAHGSGHGHGHGGGHDGGHGDGHGCSGDSGCGGGDSGCSGGGCGGGGCGGGCGGCGG